MGLYASIPKIAIAAGNAQNPNNTTDERLHCLLRRIGVDVSEFTLPTKHDGLGSPVQPVEKYRRLQPKCRG